MTLLLLLFIGLKLSGEIDWSWVWVVSPVWIPFPAVVFFMVCGLFTIGAIGIVVYFLGRDPIDWHSKRDYFQDKLRRFHLWWHGESEDPAVSWARIEKPNYDRKITLIKEIRAEFGMKLKEAKSVADKVW